MTRVLARESELRSWFDDIAGAGQKRMDELGADEQVKLAKCEAVIAENIGKAKIPENSEFGLPAIIPTDCVLMGIIGDDHAEITPSATHPGYFWVSVCTGLSTLGTDFVFLRRPIRQDMVAMALQAARFSRDAYWGNLEWDGSKPWWTKDMDQCPPVRRASA